MGSARSHADRISIVCSSETNDRPKKTGRTHQVPRMTHHELSGVQNFTSCAPSFFRYMSKSSAGGFILYRTKIEPSACGSHAAHDRTSRNLTSDFSGSMKVAITSRADAATALDALTV